MEMKKLFISCPMRGRTQEAIENSRAKMKRIAEAIMGEELEVIDSYMPETMKAIEGRYKHADVAMLGASIAQMADADVVVATEGWRVAAPGVEIECHAASCYGIRLITVKESDVIGEDELERIQRDEFNEKRKAFKDSDH